jgi:hypothetical protein
MLIRVLAVFFGIGIFAFCISEQSRAASRISTPSFSTRSSSARSYSAPSYSTRSYRAPSTSTRSYSAPSHSAPSHSAPSHSAPSTSTRSYHTPSSSVRSYSSSSQLRPQNIGSLNRHRVFGAHAHNRKTGTYEVRRGTRLGWIISGVTLIWLSSPDYDGPGYIQFGEDSFVEVPAEKYAMVYEGLTSSDLNQRQWAMSEAGITPSMAKTENDPQNETLVRDETDPKDVMKVKGVNDPKDAKDARFKNAKVSLRKNLSVFDAGSPIRR